MHQKFSGALLGVPHFSVGEVPVSFFRKLFKKDATGLLEPRDLLAQSDLLRAVTFGELPLDEWVAQKPSVEPLETLARAAAYINDGKRDDAVQVLRSVTEMSGVDSRQALEAWRALRGLGIDPGDHAKDVLGVVIEIALDLGTDTVAAYADGTARYYNQGGAAVIFEGDDAEVKGLVRGVLDAARITVTAIGPWQGALPFQPRKGEARMTILTPSGLHFGESTRSALMGDRLAAPVISAAFVLMKRLMHMVQQSKEQAAP